MKTRFFNIRKLGTKLLSSLVLASSFAMSSYAQVANYSFSQSSGTYAPITGGTIVGQATSANPGASPEDLPMDDYTYRVALPFSFAFNGAAYDSININTNGWASFGTNISSTSTPISSTATYSGVIAAFAHDQMGIFATKGITTSGSPTITNVENTSRCVVGAPIQGTNIPANANIVSFTSNSITISANATGTSSSASFVSFATGLIRMQAIGTAPNRTIVIQFSGMAKYSGSADATSNNTSFNYQIRLSETSNIISVVYGSFLITATNNYTSQVGLRGATSADYNNRTATTTWSGTTAGTTNSASVTWNNTINPASGQTFIWTPPTCWMPLLLASNTVLNTSATIKWNKPTPAPANGYDYYVSTTNTAPTASTTPTGSTTDTFKVLTNLAPSTQHYVWVRSNCGTNDKSVWTASINFTTLASCVVPTALTYITNSATSNGATIRWTRPVVLPANGYEYYVSTTNTAPTAATVPTGTATDSFKVITGLPPATLHYVWVRSNCGTADKSTWTSSVNFTTLCGTPAPGATIASSSTNICAGASVKFTLTTVPKGLGISYLWQSSLDGNNYVSITGATDSTFTTNVNAVYYRCRVICSAGPDTVYSTPVQLNYTNNIATATGAQRCGAGSLTLNATANTGAVINWFETASGGASLGTGTSFTTPLVANTTSFFAEAAVITSGTVRVGAGTTSQGTTSYPNPLSAYHGGSKHQMLFLASELTAQGLSAGDITAISFDVTNFSAAGILNDFTIRIGHATNNVMTGFVAGTNTVYNASYTPNATGVVTFTLTTPFNWDGVQNLIVETVHNQGNSGNGSGTRVAYTTTAFNSVYARSIDNITPAGVASFDATTSTSGATTTSTARPNIVFTGQMACRSTRKEVIATINTAPSFTITNDKTVCNNATTPLSVTSTQSSYNNVTWSPVTGLFTDAAATVPYVANAHAYTVYHKSNVIGSEEYIATAQNTTTLCGGIDTVKVQVMPPAITAIATPGILCTSGSSVIKINPSIPQTGELYQWQSSSDNVTFNNIGSVVSTDTLATGNLTATTYFRAIVKNSDSVNCFNSVADTVLVNTPLITSTTPASRCGLGTVILQAVANSGAVVNWYTAASGGTAIATGNAFTTPVLTANTNYYVSADIISTIQATGARPAPASISNTTPSDYGLVFNANKPFTLNSVEVYNNGSAGTVTIRLVNSGGTVLQTLNAFNVPAGNGTTPITVPLNFPVPQGNDFRLMALSGTASLVREGSIGGFPYAVGNTASVTNGYISGNTSTTYYYFYNWKLTQSDTCASPRQAVAATINPAPAFEITNDKTVCNNAVTALTVTTGNNNYDNISWSPVTNLYTNAAATTAYVAGSHAATVYYKNATAGSTVITANANNTTTHCANIDTIQIQTLPATVTAKALPKLLCESGTATLSYAPAISQTGFTQQWSGSADNVTFAEINSATNLTYTTPTLTNTRYYRVAIKNSDGATCITGTDTVKVLHPQITQTVAAERCGPGNLTLTATAVDGQATWYESATANTVLGTGNSFTTPNLNTTTTYYVAAKNGILDTVTVGSGTTVSSGYPNPFNKLWGGNRHQYLITAQELTAAGLTAGQIQGLALDIVALSTTGSVAQRTMNDLTIKLGSTANTTMAGGFVATTGLQTVYNTTGYLPTATGWNSINFNNAYSWDGISNLIVELTHNSGNGGGGGAHTIRMATTTYPATYAKWADNVTPATAAEFLVTNTTSGSTNSYSSRANLRFFLEKPCASNRVAVIATVKPKPIATLTPNGNINLCDGETQTLTASGSTGAYIWLKNNAVVTGQSASTLAVTQAAPYKVVVSSANGCTDTSAVANITVVPKPVVNLGNDTAVCANETLQLNAANPGATYEWSNNSTAQTIDVTTPGDYSVTVTNNFNCVARDTITITHLAFPVVDLGADTAICPSRPLILNAENPGAAYLWNNGSTTQTITVSQEGPYAVTVTNAANCVGSDTINITFVPEMVNNGFDFEPLFNIQPGRVRFTPIDINPNYTYSWDFGDGFTSNDAVSEHDYAANGNYEVKLTVSDGCSVSTETLSIYVDRFTSVTKVKATDIVVKVYPNPTSNVLNVALESENTYINKLSIFNMIGQQVTTIVPENKNTKQQSIQLNNLASGAYLIKIETDKGTVNRKFEFVK